MESRLNDLTNRFTAFRALGTVVCLAVLAMGCRGQKSDVPPIHPNLNMDFQTSMKTQEESTFFADGRAMRPKVAGTVARGSLVGTEEFRTGKLAGTDEFVTETPIRVSAQVLERGRDRYGIYCAPCHGGAGYADGIITQRGNLPPPSFHDARLIEMPEGQYYEAIVNGVRGNMPSYANRLSVDDRWAVIAYIRALQLSQSAELEDVPSDIRSEKGW